jgi:DNA invertase Pin-like site-specific DNA recombinase
MATDQRKERDVKAAGYVRVSTDEQVNEGWNLTEDRRLTQELADEKGWGQVELFDDGGLQGDDVDRPNLRRLLDSLADYTHLIVRDLDRYARHLPTYLDLRERVKQSGVEVWEFTNPRGPVAFDVSDSLKAVIAEDEKRKIGVRVKQAMKGRARAGVKPGGTAPYGYRWHEKVLVIVAAQARVVVRIFTDYVNGGTQRGIAHALNAEGIASPGNAKWNQSQIKRMLQQPIYVGLLDVKGDDGEWLPGNHEAIIDRELWDRAQAICTGALRRKPGRHPRGQHLLVRGLAKCRCGATLTPRAKAGKAERYVCRDRYENGTCSEPTWLREAIDGPLLERLLRSYVDLAATQERIEAREASVLDSACQTLARREKDAASAEARLARVRSHYQEGKIEPEDWAEQRPALTEAVEATTQAVQRARDHVAQAEQGDPGDAQQRLLDYLAQLKRTVGAAPDLPALRNVIGQVFERVQLVRRDDVWAGPGTPVGDRYLLVPLVRGEFVDYEDREVTRPELPVPPLWLQPPSRECGSRR